MTSLINLFGALSIQSRNAHILASISDNKGAYNKRIRLGRGPASGKGKTSGRGQKGQKAHGHVHPWFQGGQTPLIRIKGQKGFVNKRVDQMSEVNLDTIQSFIDSGRLDPTKQITPKELFDARLLTRVRDGIKLLARGKEQLKTPINIMVSRASKQAIEAVEATGGRIITRYYTKMALKRLIKGESISSEEPLPQGREYVDGVLQKVRAKLMKDGKLYYRLPDPTSRWDMEYYRDPAHRGYLSSQVREGETPSLFWKVPSQRYRTKEEIAKIMRAKKAAGGIIEEEKFDLKADTKRMWG